MHFISLNNQITKLQSQINKMCQNIRSHIIYPCNTNRVNKVLKYTFSPPKLLKHGHRCYSCLQKQQCAKSDCVRWKRTMATILFVDRPFPVSNGTAAYLYKEIHVASTWACLLCFRDTAARTATSSAVIENTSFSATQWVLCADSVLASTVTVCTLLLVLYVSTGVSPVHVVAHRCQHVRCRVKFCDSDCKSKSNRPKIRPLQANLTRNAAAYRCRLICG